MSVLVEIQQEIDRLIGEYGSKRVLIYLKDFKQTYNFKQDGKFESIKKEILSYYNLHEEDLRRVNGKSTKCKRLITWYLKSNFNMSTGNIINIMNISHKTFYNYIDYVQDVIKNPSINKDFFEDIVSITLNFKNK